MQSIRQSVRSRGSLLFLFVALKCLVKFKCISKHMVLCVFEHYCKNILVKVGHSLVSQCNDWGLRIRKLKARIRNWDCNACFIIVSSLVRFIYSLISILRALKCTRIWIRHPGMSTLQPLEEQVHYYTHFCPRGTIVRRYHMGSVICVTSAHVG